ncbi:hypothetical protein UlMin_027645 [Ulmus minor]
MGLELRKINIKRFADGEIYVQLQESVRGCDVFLLQPPCPPVNENLIELEVMIDACRRASAKNITPTQGRESNMAKLVANSITKAGAKCYFDIAVDHVYCERVILDYLASKKIYYDDLVVVFPDVGRVARARAFAKKLSDAPLAIVGKRRHGHNVAEVMNLILFLDDSYPLHLHASYLNLLHGTLYARTNTRNMETLLSLVNLFC